MWKHVIFLQTLFQLLRPLKIKYSHERGFYKNSSRSERIVSTAVVTNIGILTIGKFVGLKKFLTEDPDPNDLQAVQNYVMGGVLQLLFIGINAVVVASLWPITFASSDTAWMMNQAHLFSKRRKLSNVPTKKRLLDNSTMFTIVMWSTACAALTGLLTLTLAPIVSSANPANILLSLFCDNSKRTWKMKAAEILYLFLSYMGVYPIVSIALVYTSTIHLETPFLLPRISDYKTGSQNCFAVEQHRHRVAFLFIESFNKFGNVFFPLLILGGFLLNVSTSFVCIKYGSSLDALLIAIFISFDLSVAIVTAGLHTFSCISLEASVAFRKYWRYHAKSKLQRRQLRALKPIVVKIGPFFDLRRSVIVTTFDQIVNQTVSVLIMDS